MNENVSEEDSTDSEQLERRVNFNLLYDFYSPLLTDRQRKIYEMVCFSDLTLTEAAETLGISRQAVHIVRQRVENRLEAIEKDLCFAETTRKLGERIRQLEEENSRLKAKEYGTCP